jgi:putative transposase
MNTLRRHRLPVDIISYALEVYCRLKPSHRDVENLLAERGIVVIGMRLPERAFSPLRGAAVSLW